MQPAAPDLLNDSCEVIGVAPQLRAPVISLELAERLILDVKPAVVAGVPQNRRHTRVVNIAIGDRADPLPVAPAELSHFVAYARLEADILAVDVLG